jgi:hypothetical protein
MSLLPAEHAASAVSLSEARLQAVRFVDALAPLTSATLAAAVRADAGSTAVAEEEAEDVIGNLLCARALADAASARLAARQPSSRVWRRK